MPNGQPWNIERFEELARERGGKLISCVSGSGLRGRYIWECEDGHQWEARGGNIVTNHTWCKECQKLTIEDCYKEAEKRGGKCLDTVYVNKRTIMNWECRKGHQFALRLGAVRNNERWCKKCFTDIQRHDISLARQLAAKHEGECLSTEYVNLETPMWWRCKNGHEWQVAMSGIKSSAQWCRKCHMRNRRDKSIDRVYKWVEMMNGEILTDKKDIPYGIQSNTITINIKCNKNHVWNSTFESLQHGSWCPNCRFKSESACREILENIYQVPFPKKRLAEMEYLELDGYCEEFGIAFEYNGRQHEKYIPYFHRNGPDDLIDQIARDERKKELCVKNNISLIEIPCSYDYTRKDELETYILSELETMGY